MSARHTPGPWDLRAIRGDFDVLWSVGVFKMEIAEVCTDAVHGDANARLIVAAPDLLEACEAEEAAQEARSNCAECDGEDDWTHCAPCSLNFGKAIDLRRAAIAKATQS
jgi:hypothetical protein